MRLTANKNLFERVTEAVANHRLIILAVFLLVVGSGMIATLLITPKYEATMSILISRDRVDIQVNPTEKLPDVTQAAISDEEFNSELELIKSSEVIAGVVRELDLVNNQAPKSDTWLSSLRQKIKTALYDFPGRTPQGKGAGQSGGQNDARTDFTLEKTITRVQGNLDVVPIKKSRIIKVNYRDTDPLRAKNTLEKLYQKYVELHVQLNEKAQAKQVFDEQTDAFGRKLKSSTNTLKKFDAQNEISGADLGVQRELLLKQLYDAKSQLSTTQAEIRETEQRIADLQEKIKAQPEQVQTGSVSKYVSALDRMKEELVQLEQQKTQLIQKYQPNSRIVRDHEVRIDKLKKSIAEETANPPQEKSFALNELKRKLMTELYTAQTNLAALKEREKALAPLVARLSDQSAQLNIKSIERASLEREKNINEEAYLLYQKKSRENEISQVLNKERIVNASLVDPPRTDGEQKNPKPLLNLLVLIGLGSSAGLASALVLDKFSQSDDDCFAGSPRELEERWDLPVLASIPYIQAAPEYKLETKPQRLLPAPPAKKKRLPYKNY